MPTPTFGGPMQTYGMKASIEAHLQVQGAVMVLLVTDPTRKNAPRFIVSGADNVDPEFLHNALLGGLDTMFHIMRHQAGQAQGQTQTQSIIAPPAGLKIPPFPPGLRKA